jgi:peptidyl-prolyl cis-trans isomerase C
VQEKVEQWVDLILMARAAEASGENIDASLKEYSRNLAVRILLAQKEQQWIPNEKTLLDYFQKHPKIGYIPERRQIGQIVLASQQEAEKIRERILQGESLFTLAGLYSIDPYGKQRSGDMGWLTEGSASPEIEAVLKLLQDNEISPVIKTAKGWHLITIVNRKPAEQKNFADIKDRVRQKLLAEKMTGYIQQVTARYPLKWQLPDKDNPDKQ